MHLLFWTLFALVIYVYAGYPLMLLSGLLGRRRSLQKADILPSFSVIIPAHNEAENIENKILNLLEVDYPRELVEILVGDDGSSDRTKEIVEGYANCGVHLTSNPDQRGKSAIQNELVKCASGAVLVFTDADCSLAPNALRCIARNFADPSIGLVTGTLNYSNADETEVTRNESLYLRYESWVRSQQSEQGLLAIASGALFAMRRSLWRPLDVDVGDDFVLPLQVVIQGFRNVLEKDLRVRTRLTQNEHSSMMRLKMRIVSKDLRGLMTNSSVLNPFHSGAIAISVWSHKLLKWLVPYFLLLMLFANLFSLRSAPYWILLAIQLIFYAAAVAGLSKFRDRFPWSVASSFCLVNTAALLGSLHFLRGGTMGRWKPTR